MSDNRDGPPLPSRSALRLQNDMMAGTAKSPDYPENIYRAAAQQVARRQSELDITNADHIALWLEENLPDASLAYLACRIVEAHEAALPEGGDAPAVPADVEEAELQRLQLKKWWTLEKARAERLDNENRSLTAALAATQKQLAEAREVIRALLDREGERASNKDDCNCIFLSRQGEREYENGTCPHQRARAFLSSSGGPDHVK